MPNRPLSPVPPIERKLVLAMAIVALQIVAVAYFVMDAIVDANDGAADTMAAENIMEFIVALALLAGIVMGAAQTQKLFAESRRREHAIAIARGALSEFVDLRFSEWRLSKAESDVAFFVLKGCNIAQIAELRGAAAGTVRAQLSQVYAKAGVTSQSMLVSLFIDDLLVSEDDMTA